MDEHNAHQSERDPEEHERKSQFLSYLSLIMDKKIPFVLAATDPATGIDLYKTHGSWGARRGLAENLLDMVKIECDMIQMFEADDESEE